MRKLLVVFTAATLIFSSATFAATLDEGMIRQIHDQVKSTVADKCQKEMNGSAAACACLGDKVAENLDDEALGLCSNDQSGSSCITSAVAEASRTGLTEDNLLLCSKPGSEIDTQ